MIFAVLAGCISPGFQLPQTTPTSVSIKNHILEKVNNFEPIWKMDEVFVIWNRFDIPLTAAFNKTCYLGDLRAKYKGENIICIDSKSGSVLWNLMSGIHNAITITASGIFVTYASPAEIRHYDIQKGDLIWRKTLGGSGSLYLYSIDNQVQVLTEPEVFWVFNADGNLVKKEVGKRIFASFPDVTYLNENGLQAVKTGTNDLLWEYTDFRGVHSPVFTQNEIFLRSGDWQGNIYALDKKTGKLLWSTANIISNVVDSPEKQSIYALGEDGSLLAFNEHTGEESIIGKFSSPPFVSGGQASVGYQLAYDQSEHILIISLGDSSQLFALREKYQ